MAEEILTHSREIIDDDREFVIDPETKQITAGTNNLTISRMSKNSERLTFLIPDKIVEGHDMSVCNSVQIHFQNIKEDLTETNVGIYIVEDLAVLDDNSVALSWLVDDDATQYAGALIFSIHFACFSESGDLLYNFPTLTYSKLTVGDTVWNSETLVNKYPNIISDFETRIAALESGKIDSSGSQPVLTAIDFSNFENGSYTETVDGAVISHAVTFDDSGRPTKVDDIVITWGS